MTAAIEVRGVSKRFRLYHDRPQSLKERVIHLGRSSAEDFWALQELDLTVERGETFGILGHNGSGKSTLLKLVAGILRPTTGTIHTEGRLAALLELGTGFHPDLTGRENVFLNAAILGIPEEEIAGRFDEIVEFSELDQFIDQQVKHYSSGMVVRLGFAVAIHVDPEVLLVDEVLAVGDEAFQGKCLSRVRELQKEGRTIVFVSHSVDTVRQICDRAAVLDHGKLVMTGPTGEAVRSMRETLFAVGAHRRAAAAADEEAGESAEPDDRLWIRGVDLDHPGKGERPYLVSGEPLTVHVGYQAAVPVDDVVVSFAVYDRKDDQLFGTSTEILGTRLPPLEGPGTISFHLDEVPLLDGEYFVSVKITDIGGGTVYDWRARRDRFEVMNPGRATGRIHLPVTVEHETSDAAAEPTAFEQERTP